MTHHTTIEQELMTHAASLRRLARTLVGEQDADDLVQDVAVEALRTPPRVAGGMGGWLAGVARHVACRRRRAERSRMRREQYAARPEAMSARDDGGDGEALRRLTSSVLSLPEPYRQAVLLRYLRGLAPREIAAQTGEPVATIKTRLRRALAMLRATLERETGPDWRATIATGFGVGSPALVGTLATTSAIQRIAISWVMSKPGLMAMAALLTLSIGAALVLMVPSSQSATAVQTGAQVPAGDATNRAATPPVDARLAWLHDICGDTSPLSTLIRYRVALLQDLGKHPADARLWHGLERLVTATLNDPSLSDRRTLAASLAHFITHGPSSIGFDARAALVDLKAIARGR